MSSVTLESCLIWLLFNRLIYVKLMSLKLKTSNSNLYEALFDLAYDFIYQRD